MPGERPGRTVVEFQVSVRERLGQLFWGELVELAAATGGPVYPGGVHRLTMPLALLLVIPPEHGGDTAAQEVIRRFEFLHHESGEFLDFFFLGWRWNSTSEVAKGITFDLVAFEECRQSLKKAGIRAFGGNADLILIDALFVLDSDVSRYSETISLNFSEAIHIDLSSAQRQGDITSIGEFLQSLIRAAETVRQALGARAGARAISDELGVRVAGNSLLNFVLEKWGQLIGAKKLARLCVRDLGPKVSLDDLNLSTAGKRVRQLD